MLHLIRLQTDINIKRQIHLVDGKHYKYLTTIKLYANENARGNDTMTYNI